MTPCPLCWGKGGWSKNTYAPMMEPTPTDRHRSEWHRCPLCEGKGRVALDIPEMVKP